VGYFKRVDFMLDSDPKDKNSSALITTTCHLVSAYKWEKEKPLTFIGIDGNNFLLCKTFINDDGEEDGEETVKVSYKRIVDQFGKATAKTLKAFFMKRKPKDRAKYYSWRLSE